MVDISLLDSQLSLLTYQAAYYFLSGVLPEPLGSSHTSIVPFQAFKARDGYFCVAVVGERMWGRFCRAIERGELVADRRFASGADRLHHRRELTSELAGIFSTKSRGLWVERLQREGVPAAPVNNLAEALAEPAVLARNMVIEVDHRGEKVSLLGNPVKLDGMNEEYSPPAALGQDTEAVLGELGVRAEEFQALKDEGVV
jgi:crotonobetainyl-CoA:carnitine CoA-transferase CaiB-like acyl-CoA transferase